jgi:hypothetical protein
MMADTTKSRMYSAFLTLPLQSLAIKNSTHLSARGLGASTPHERTCT